jgi:hypothetical protein
MEKRLTPTPHPHMVVFIPAALPKIHMMISMIEPMPYGLFM